MKSYTLRSAAAIDMLAIAFFWCISLIIVNPTGNFPLNDDWSFGIAVRHLIEDGDFRPTGWTSMPLISQVLWGAIFCIPAGFSFDALRLSTLTLSLLGILGAYLLMRELRQPRWLAVMVALTLGFNPIYYALSNTFMTDIPFTAILILASLFFLRSLRTGSDIDLLLGTTLAVAATLCRQLGVSVPLAFAVSLLLKRGVTSRYVMRAVIPSAVCIGSLFAFGQWLAVTGRLPELYYTHLETMLHMLTNPKMLITEFATRTCVDLLYLGWFLSPLLIFALPNIWVSHRNKAIVVRPALLMAAMVLLSLTLFLWDRGRLSPMPIGENIITTSGIGPLTLHDTYLMHLNHMPSLPSSFWLVMTAISLIGGAFLATAMGVTAINLVPRLWPAKMNDNQAATTFLLLSATIYMLPLLIAGFFDRYLVPAIPFLAAAIASSSAQPPRTCTGVRPFVAAVLIGVFFVFAICGTRDYLAWNRVRWVALDDLMESRRAEPEDIDGGFEFNELHRHDPHHNLEPEKSQCRVKRDTYMIAFGRIPGYTVIKEYSYRHWMPPHNGYVVVLKKDPQDTGKRRGDEHAEQDAPTDADKPRC